MLLIKYIINGTIAVILYDARRERGGWGRHVSDADRRKVVSMTSIWLSRGY